MNRPLNWLRSKSISFITTAACVVVLLSLAVVLTFTTFYSFRSGVNYAVRVMTQELSTQIVYNYENYVEDIINTSVVIQAEVNYLHSYFDTYVGYDRLSDFFRSIKRMNREVIEITLYDFTSRIALASSIEQRRGRLLMPDYIWESAPRWFVDAAANPTLHIFSVPYADDENEFYSLIVSRLIRMPDGNSGVLNIEISFRRFIELVDKSNLGAGGHITVIDPIYGIVYTSLDVLPYESIDVVRQITLGFDMAQIGAHNMAVNVDTLSHTRWRIAVFINVDMLTEIEQSFLMTALISIGIILVIGVIVFIWINRIITSPIKQLERVMRTVEKSDYFRMEIVDTFAFKEVNALLLRFNKMMRKISDLMEHVVIEQDARRKSELLALQNQINPHFLYNTLESITWVIENGKNEEAAKMVTALARLFRLGLMDESETVPLKNEIEHVRNYLLIQSFRYADSFEYNFDIQPEALEARTMKLILQPIVENCIYHGLKNNIDKGFIEVSAKIRGRYLVLTISDNGYGMREEKIKELYESFEDTSIGKGVGLKNVYRRIMMYYGENAEMLIESELDCGTTITIKEPIL